MSATPQWLLESEPGLCPCGCIGIRRRRSFVDKTLAGASGVLRQALVNEEVAARAGLLQRLDARVKLASLLALVLTASLVHRLPVLAGLYALTLALAAASRLPLGPFIRRVWLSVPLFTAIVVIPATFSFVTPGEVVVPLGGDGGLTRQGLAAAALIVARVAASVSIVAVLTLTTRWTDLLGALAALRVPSVFVLTIGMAHRYLLALVDSVDEMFLARRARTVGRDTHGRAFVAASAGALFGKAHALSEEVHQAMVARGYRGRPRSLAPTRLRPADAAWLLGCAAVAAAAIGADRLLHG